MGAFLACSAMSCACSCFSGVLDFTLGQATRFGHALIVLSLFVMAAILGLSNPSYFGDNTEYTRIQFDEGCADGYLDNCIYRQMVYRASLSLFVLFTALAGYVYCSDQANRNFWIVKFSFAILLWVGFWWVDNGTFANWAIFCRALSFLFLLVQSLMFIDFTHDLHDIILAQTNDTENKVPQVVYLGVSMGALACAIVGLVYLFRNVGDCPVGQFFTIVTLVFGVLSTIISLLNSVNKGLLTPTLMFAYLTFLCWYALLLNPNKECNPLADSIHGGPVDTAVAVVCSLTLVIVFYVAVIGTRLFQIFDPVGQGVVRSYTYNTKEQQRLDACLTGEEFSSRAPEAADGENGNRESAGGVVAPELGEDASGIPVERAFYCILLAIVSGYGAMTMTTWGDADGSPASSGNNQTALASQWLIIVAQWLSMLFYAKILHAAYVSGPDEAE